MAIRTDPLVRIKKHYRVDPATGCWEWTAGKSHRGYGKFCLTTRSIQAHRAMWILLRGPLTADQQLDHLCRNRACVNPEHLEPVDCRTNLLRGETLAAANARKTHCPNGHAYDDVNTLVDSEGKRRCRTCRSALWARRARQAREKRHARRSEVVSPEGTS